MYDKHTRCSRFSLHHASFSSFLFTHSVLFQNFYMQSTVLSSHIFMQQNTLFWVRAISKWKIVQIENWINGGNKGEDEVQGYLQVPLASFSLWFFFKNFTMQLTIAWKFRFLYMQQKNLFSVWDIRDWKILQTEKWLNGLLSAYMHMICRRLLDILPLPTWYRV